MPHEFRFDVFLSHNHADKPRMRRLAERLKSAGVQMEAGLRLWWDEWVIQAGEIIALKVDEGLEQSRVLLLPFAEVPATDQTDTQGQCGQLWRAKFRTGH